MKDRRMKIIWSSNGFWANSGYSTETKELLYRMIEDGWPTNHIAFYGLDGFNQEMLIKVAGREKELRVKTYPKMADAYGSDALVHFTGDSKSNVVFTMQDVWTIQPEALGNLRTWCPYVPIDQEPVPPQVLDRLRFAYKIITFSKFGYNALQKLGFTSTLIPEGINLNTFKPLDKLEMRKKFNLPPDIFLFGMIGANKENPPRKGYQEALDAFADFASRHPEARIMFHTQQMAPGNFPIIEYAKVLGIGDKIIFLDLVRGTYFFDGEKINEELNCFDVLLHPSQTEGFGLLSVEAQAAGIPVIVNDCTCYDEKTKILTSEGIKNFDEIKENDLVLGLDGLNLVWQPTEKKYSHGFDGEMIRFNNKQFDLLVTPNHRMLFSKKGCKGREYKEAVEFLKDKNNYYYFPVSGDWNGNDKISIDKPVLNTNSKSLKEPIDLRALLRIVGWYISEGCLDRDKTTRYNQIRISNTQEKYLKEIVNDFKLLGVHSKVYRNTFVGVKGYSIHLAEFLKKFGVSKYKKTITKEVLQLDKSLLQELFNTMMKGDGSKCGSKRFIVYITSSEKLKNDFVELVLKLGYSPKVCFEEGVKTCIRGRDVVGGKIWRISVRYQARGIMQRKQIKKEYYKGKVWCLKTRTSNFFVERNGKIVCSGNSMPELVVEGKTGEICRAGYKRFTNAGGYWYPADVPSLIEKMELLYKNLHEPNNYKIACRQHIKDNYDIDKIFTEKWIPTLEELQDDIMGKIPVDKIEKK